ncbi:DEAD/DEAH box helicase domain protein [Planctopirus limnophila DSM 3776]|uniref:DEAD/DEAH box helicase domain protein n=1 Tax=Planctopirus limnophila (strain ATCC 43296 / DSM 3776 / IFAM 1008 / Mu 290) TaxID=521674 RepID=D5SSU4_PLAL2|nr:DEAD/DEAH box helicase [Planctopirus limnophila]ADG68895.1 DEAD/DEAH box helicase domain protein [Planctopirus limnophila DSM 3776]
MVSVFSRLAPRLQQAIVARLGWSSLRPVQELAGEALLSGRNAVILAPTAGGKTEASMFPTLSNLVDQQPVGVGAIYVAPIKALLNNQEDRLGLYTEMVGLRRFVWHGDTTTSARKQFLDDPAELLMTTPESLEVMLVSQRVDERALFGDLRMIVIDEVHAIAGTDRGAHLMSVIERIRRVSRHDIQRAGLSATVGNPAAILEWLKGTSEREGVVVDPPKRPSRRQLLIVHEADQTQIAVAAAQVARGCKSLFFCQSRATTEAVAETMRRSGTTVFVHHSAVSKEERLLAEQEFHHGSGACIVCTSTLELGIDVGDLDKVLQANAPETVGSFLQRMGRTGRREGQAANTTFFCESTDSILQAIALIELAKAGWVEDVPVNQRCWPVLIHQLLAMSLAENGIPTDVAWKHLCGVPDFQRISRKEFDRLIEWMIQDGSLLLMSGRLILGPQAERRFGRRNFMELYAVFSSPQSYNVETVNRQVIGTLTQDFVDGLVDGVSCFLLGGRAWAVFQVVHKDRLVVVEPAPRGRQPTWGGYLPQFLGFHLCQKILEIVTADDEYQYLMPPAADLVTQERNRMECLVEPIVGGINFNKDGNEVIWHTFAGGRVNSTIRYAIGALQPTWTITPDNFSVRFRDSDITETAFKSVIRELASTDFWNDDSVWQEVRAALPGYRLSKFQPLMPACIEQEVLFDYLLDRHQTADWVRRIL